MRIYVSLICFFICTPVIMEPSKETCTAYTFQEKTKWKESTEMSQTTITLLFLVFTIISFILEKIPLGLTASICAIGLTLTGVVDATTTFSQYVNSNVILCVGMFVVGQALFETGMANKIGGLVTKFARTEKTLIIAIMVIVGVMSGFLSNTGTAAVLIPVVPEAVF